MKGIKDKGLVKMEKVIICRCEEVALDDIVDTVRSYTCSAREVKLRTRAAMGYCGGRTCRTAVDAIIRSVAETEESVHARDEIPLKVQPPVRPVSIALLGSRVKHDE